jgi:hypothetical protein
MGSQWGLPAALARMEAAAGHACMHMQLAARQHLTTRRVRTLSSADSCDCTSSNGWNTMPVTSPSFVGRSAW